MFRKLTEQKECRIEEGHLLANHVHMMISIPPKCSVPSVVGFIKGKSAIHLARVYGERKQNYAGQSFWARAYFVSEVVPVAHACGQSLSIEVKRNSAYGKKQDGNWPAKIRSGGPPSSDLELQSGFQAKSLRPARDPKTSSPVPNSKKLGGSGVTWMSKFAEASVSPAWSSPPPVILNVPA